MTGLSAEIITAVGAIMGMSVVFFAISRIKSFLQNGMPARIADLESETLRQRDRLVKLEVLVETLTQALRDEAKLRRDVYDRILRLEQQQ